MVNMEPENWISSNKLWGKLNSEIIKQANGLFGSWGTLVRPRFHQQLHGGRAGIEEEGPLRNNNTIRTHEYDPNIDVHRGRLDGYKNIYLDQIYMHRGRSTVTRQLYLDQQILYPLQARACDLQLRIALSNTHISALVWT